MFSVLGLGAIFVEWVVWGILFIHALSDSLHVVYLLAPFLCFTCFHLTMCIVVQTVSLRCEFEKEDMTR